MFKRFKRRQLISNVSILTILLFVIFSSLFISTYRDVNTRNESELRRLITIPEDGFQHGQFRLSPGSISFIVVVENDSISEVFSSINMPTEIVDEAFSEVKKDDGKVEVEGFTFMYLTEEVNGVTVIGFTDVTFDEQLLDSLLIRYLLIFLVSIVFTFVVSYFITSKSIQPVKESYDKQKEFIANASHELKTPLTVINTNVDVLLSNKQFENNKWLQYIKSESNRMNKLTNDLLYLARTSEVANTQPTIYNVSTQLEGLVLSMEALAFENKILLQYDILENKFIKFDQNQFTQLMLILLDNAIKYTPENNEIFVSLEKKSKTLKLSVKNTGVTLSEEEINNVFERFYMSDKSRERNKNSYGLGLSIAHEISANNNTQLKVKSEDNYTEFYLYLNEKKESN